MAVRHDIEMTPRFPTAVKKRYPDGRCVSTPRSPGDRGTWLYRAVPLGAVTEATTPDGSLLPGQPLMEVMDGLATLASEKVRVARRSLAKSSYRETHQLLINVPRAFDPGADTELGRYLLEQFPHETIDRRILLFGVRLIPKLNTSGIMTAAKAVADALISTEVPMAEYERDFRIVSDVMDRAGLRRATDAELDLADAWWNQGLFPDTPMLPHRDHVHIFQDMHGAQSALTLQDGGDPCTEWPTIAGSHVLSFASAKGLESGFVQADSSTAHWAARLIQQGAIMISIRGRIEPTHVTRRELRTMRQKYINDIKERHANHKMSDEEQTETLSQLSQVEGFYAQQDGGSPTLVDASVIVAFTGRHETRGYNPAEAGREAGIGLRPMEDIQEEAFAETLIASGVRANPRLSDLPIQTVAYSGLPSLTTVGDRKGAFLGITERDRQPSWIDHTRSSDDEVLPLLLVAGQSGSGKATRLSTIVQTPSGAKVFGDLAVGDEVLGRDGKPCRVLSQSPIHFDSTYRITLSDGQQVVAGGQHQWVVADFQSRNGIRHPHRTTAQSVYEQALSDADLLDSLAERAEPAGLRLEQLTERLHREVPGQEWTTLSVYGSLRMTDCPQTRVVRSGIPMRAYAQDVVKTDPVVLYDTTAALTALEAHWSSIGAGNAVRWAGVTKARRAAAVAALATVSAGQESTIPDIARMLNEHGAAIPTGKTKARATIAGALRSAQAHHPVPSRRGHLQVRLPVAGITRETTKEVVEYDVPTAYRHLALRLRQRHAQAPVMEAVESVMSTEEILGRGLRIGSGAARFAIRVSDAVDLPAQDMPVPAYTLGAWLGDGSSSGGQIASDGKNGDRAWMVDQLRSDGIDASASASSGHVIDTRGLKTQLRAAGVLGAKHIPELYFTGSVDQRLALLQGLMDTDGTIGRSSGGCEIALSDTRLATDTLRLVRSLGIKASMTTGKAGYRDADGEYVPCKDRHRIKFTTTLPVFRMPRKASLLPTQLRETSRWLYVTDVTPVDQVPMRCITVDSPDSTYLIEDYVPTHNSVTMAWLGNQFVRIRNSRGERTPVVIADPKVGSDFTAAVEMSPEGQIISLDQLTSADGIFDPFRFSQAKEGSGDSAAEMAADVILGVNPFGDQMANFEVPLLKALKDGASRGAKCTMQALELAEQFDGAPPQMVKMVRDVYGASPMFAALCGRTPQGSGLSVAEGITYIRIGNANLSLPQPGQTTYTLPQRVTLALIRCMIYGTMHALAGRQGVILLDEAWVFLSAGRSEMERLGRLARSLQVFPILFTQRVTDATNAGLSGYIDRVLILPISDDNEARSACELARIEPTPDRIGRIRAKSTLGEGEGTGMNWRSMRALKDPITGKVARGVVGLYCDADGRVANVPITIPPAFLAEASTSRKDVEARETRRAAAREAALAAAPIQPVDPVVQPTEATTTDEAADLLDDIA